MAEIIAEPAQGKSRALGDAHNVPFSRNRMAERMDAPARVELGRVRVSKDHSRSAQRGGSQSRENDAIANSAGRLVARRLPPPASRR